MCVDSLLLKFNSDEKLFSWLFISSVCPLCWGGGGSCVQGSEWPSTSRVILC